MSTPDRLATRAWAARTLIAFAVDPSTVFRMPDDLADYWLHGEGAAKIRWCTKGSFRRAQRALREYVSPEALDGTVANLFHRACGKWPGPHGDDD